MVALHRLAGQLRWSDGILITQLSAVGVEGLAIERLGRVVADHPGVLSDAALVRLAHGAAGPQTAADLIDLRGERVAFADAVQRMYTDDGHGDGRLTWAGVRQLSTYAAIYWTGGPDRDDPGADGAALLPFTVASRAQVTTKYAAFMDRLGANLARPRRSADWASLTGRSGGRGRASAVDRVRFAALFPFLLLTDRPQVSARAIPGRTRWAAGRPRPGAVPPPPRPTPGDAGRADAGPAAERAGRPDHRRPGSLPAGRRQAGRLQRRCGSSGRRRAAGGGRAVRPSRCRTPRPCGTCRRPTRRGETGCCTRRHPPTSGTTNDRRADHVPPDQRHAVPQPGPRPGDRPARLARQARRGQTAGRRGVAGHARRPPHAPVAAGKGGRRRRADRPLRRRDGGGGRCQWTRWPTSATSGRRRS